MKNTEYWNNEGAGKTFTHPVCLRWIAGVDRQKPVLDLGCGYGRLTPVLLNAGFSDIFSYDPSAVLIDRALGENPGAHYVNDPALLMKKSFGLIFCFAVFTSCPSEKEQEELAELIDSLSHEGTCLYISDYETGDNPNYQKRYEQKQLGIFGCFSSGNAIFRHHRPGHFSRLLPQWKIMNEKIMESQTMNGNNIVIHQYLLCKGNKIFDTD